MELERKPPRTRLQWIFRFFAASGLLVIILTLTPLVPWWTHKMSGPLIPAKGDTLIVLASNPAADGIIGYSTYLRCEYAVRAWREGGFHTILVSGGGPRQPEALVMKQFLVASGVPASAIQAETESNSTRQSALNCRRILGGTPDRKVLLTSDYHMFRALRTFRKAGIEVIPRPFPDAIKRSSTFAGRWPAFLDMLEESAKIGYYWARRWI